MLTKTVDNNNKIGKLFEDPGQHDAMSKCIIICNRKYETHQSHINRPKRGE